MKQQDFLLKMVLPGVVEVDDGTGYRTKYDLSNAQKALEYVTNTPEQYATKSAYEKHMQKFAEIVAFLERT